MSDKIAKNTPDKVRKRTVSKLTERKAYDEMIKQKNTDYRRVVINQGMIHNHYLILHVKLDVKWPRIVQNAL